MAQHPAILRRRQVQVSSGQSRSTLYTRIRQGLWTRPVRLGPRMVGWPASEMTAILAARVAGQSDEEIKALVRQLEVARRSLPWSKEQ